MSLTCSREELEKLSYEELSRLAVELEAEGGEIKKVRHHFIDELWRRVRERPVEPEDLSEGEMVAVKMGERQILFAKVEEKIYAFSNRCPHKGFPLQKGKLEGYKLTCAYHGGQFDIRDGACVKHPYETYPCAGFEVRLLPDGTVECE